MSGLFNPTVAGITLLLGIDRFMSEMRSVSNLIGNAVATITVARWQGQFDTAQALAELRHRRQVLITQPITTCQD